jgi:hypothetical protein
MGWTSKPRPPKNKKRPVSNQRFDTGPCPLRHIGNIVIWEGNYTPDTLNIGRGTVFLEKNRKISIKNEKKTPFGHSLSEISTSTVIETL